MQHLDIYRDQAFYESHLLPVTLKVTVAWGWFMFSLNTIFTVSIIAKILCVYGTRPHRQLLTCWQTRLPSGCSAQARLGGHKV
jgi:hypothetical protein